MTIQDPMNQGENPAGFETDYLIEPRSIPTTLLKKEIAGGEFLGKSLGDLLPATLVRLFENHSTSLTQQQALAYWESLQDQVPRGIDPVVRDFLKAHPDCLGLHIDRTLGTKSASPAAWLRLSEMLHPLNQGQSVTGISGYWVAPEGLLTKIIGQELTARLISFARESGLSILNAAPKPSTTTLHLDTDAPGL